MTPFAFFLHDADVSLGFLFTTFWLGVMEHAGVRMTLRWDDVMDI